MFRDKVIKVRNDGLIKMFEVVGITKDINWILNYCEQKDWYLNHTWSAKQQDEFMLWFQNLVSKRLKISKVAAKREISWFILNYGWKCEEGE